MDLLNFRVPKDPKFLKQNEQLKGKRAVQISKEEFDRRRAAKVCFRYARKGCGTHVCPLLPYQNPRD